MLSPCARGWTVERAEAWALGAVVPVRTGVDRTRGSNPEAVMKLSPCARGWTGSLVAALEFCCVVPVRTGVDR